MDPKREEIIRNREGQLIYEDVALESMLDLKYEGGNWYPDEDSLHIDTFHYDIYALEPAGGQSDDDADDKIKVGSVEGYIIAHGGETDSEEIREEADALDGDIHCYVESLVEELRVCNSMLRSSFDLSCIPRLLVIGHLDAEPGVDSGKLTREVVALLLLKEAPSLVVVDPYEMPTEEEMEAELRTNNSPRRRIPKLTAVAQQRIDSLRSLGFVQMVTSSYVWGWTTEIAESFMGDYSRSELVRATVTLYADEGAPVDGEA